MELNFSVVLIARNESKTLPRLIATLEEFKARGGEIILVDTGSTDGTAEIARSLGCKVEEVGDRFRRTITEQQAYQINRQFRVQSEEDIVKAGDTLFDYSGARNYAASLSSNDMCAMPDCDEVYTALDLDAVCKAIADGVEQLEYNFVFSHDEKGNEVIKFLHSKFYDRRKLAWTGIIHEVLTGDARRQFFPEDVIKLEHFQNEETNRSGYLKGLALSVLLEPENDRHAHYFGRELLYTGRPRSAIKQLQRHTLMGGWAEERSQSFIHIGDAYRDLGEYQAAVHAWVDAFDACPTRREPLMRLAEFYDRSGCPDHVIAYVSAALAIPPGNFYAAFWPYYEDLPQKLLDRAHALKNAPRLTSFPKVSIIVPTLRPQGLERLMISIENLDYPRELIETIVLHDEPRLGVPKRVKEGVEKATGEWIVYAADDIEFDRGCITAALLTAQVSGKHLVALNEGPVSPDKGNICTHWMISRNLALDTTYFPNGVFDTDFHHVGVDNLLWATMEEAREAIRSEEARITHHHFSKGGEMDDVYRTAWDPEHVAADRALLAQKLAAL